MTTRLPSTAAQDILAQISAAQRERLAYIEFRLWFLGEVTRMHVLDRFGIATAAGTRDLALYKTLAPDNAMYQGKRFHHGEGFRPLFQHHPQRVLLALTEGFGDGDRIVEAGLLPHAGIERVNLPRLDTLAAVTRAIHGGYALQLSYHSMKTGAGTREIVPHALVDAGHRWHVRAYDRTKAMFRDLVLTRMERIVSARQAGVATHERLAADRAWQQQVTLELVPHPAHPHPAAVAMDYGMQDGRLAVTVRATVAGYLLRQLHVDCSPDRRMDPSLYRISLANPAILTGLDNAVLAPGMDTSAQHLRPAR